MLKRYFYPFLFAFLFLTLSTESFSQGCSGDDGTGIFSGGATLANNGDICANSATSPGLMKIEIGNLDNTGTIEFEINWQDGSAVEVVPGVQSTTDPTTYSVTVPHFFPAVAGQCEYEPQVRLRFNGTPCAGVNLGTPPRFVRWNTDDQNTGRLELQETVTGVNEYLVCEGAQTTVTFTDQSTLNCVPPDLPTGANNRMRWRQFVYGTGASNITGTVLINGNPQGFPFNGIVDASPASVLNSGFPTPTTNSITIPATAVDGQIFEVTMNYWNFCNSYPANLPVTTTARIRVVKQPPIPTATDRTVCADVAAPDFQVNFAGASSTVNWFRDNGGLPGTPITNPNGTNSRSLPASAIGVAMGNSGTYTVWVSYNGVANVENVNCESVRIPVSLTIKSPLAQPDALAPADVCNGSTLTFTQPVAPGSQPFGGAAQYEWIVTDNANNAVTDVTLTPQGDQRSVQAAFNLTGSFTTRDRKIRVRRIFTTGDACPSPWQDIIVTVYGLSQKGTVDGGGAFCEGTDVGSVTWTPGRGNVVRWEVSVNGGAFADAGLGTVSTINPGMLTAGSYLYHAIIANGTCAPVTSDDVSFTISANPTIAFAGNDQAWCNRLTSDPFGASAAAPGVGTWTLVSKPNGAPNPTISNPNDRNATATISSFAVAGIYTFRWTVVNGSCTSSDDILIDFGGDPTNPAAGGDRTICGETTALQGNTPTIGTGTWTVVSGPGGCTTGCPITIADPLNPASGISLNGAPYTYGAYTLRWTIRSGTCVAETDDVIITFTQPATATPMADLTECFVDVGPFSPITLTGTVAQSAQGRWEIVNGSGTIQSSGGANGNPITAPSISDAYIPVAADYNTGANIVLRLVALDPDAGGPCAAVTATVNITVERRPRNVSAGTDQINICSSDAQLHASTPQYGTGTWSTTAGGVTFDDPADPQTQVHNLPVGTTTFTWTVASLGTVCSNITATVQLTRVALPTAVNLNPEVCDASPGAPLDANIDLTFYNDDIINNVADRTVFWYKDAPPPTGIALSDAPPTQMGVITGATYIARVQDNTTLCTSDATIVFTIIEQPAVTDNTVRVCEDVQGSGRATGVDLNDTKYVNAVIGTATNVITKWYNSALDAQNDVNAITTAIDINGSMTVYARVISNDPTGCYAVAKLDLFVNPLPLDQAIFGKEAVCQGALELYQLTRVPGAKYIWDIPTGPGEFEVFGGGGENDAFVLINFPNQYTGTIKVKIDLNDCGGNDMTKTITVSPTPTPFSVQGDDVVCENEIGVEYSITPNNYPGSSYTWEVIPAGSALIANGQTTGTVHINFLATDVEIRVRESNSANCAGPTQQYFVTVNRRPIMDDPNKELCSDEATNITFQDAPASPVAATQYNITSASVTTGLIPTSGPTQGTALSANAIFNDAFENPRAVPLTVRYTVTPITIDASNLKECPGSSRIVTISVKPEPQLDPNLSKTLCSDDPTQITLVSAPNTFPADQFVVESITNVSGLTPLVVPPATGTPLGNNAIYGNKWENTTSDNAVISYLVRPVSSVLGCAGDPPTNIDVTIYPKPLVAPVTMPPVCSGDQLNVVLSTTNNVVGVTYIWNLKSINGNIVGATSSQGLAIRDILINNDMVQGSVVYEVQALNPASKGNCLGPVQEVEILVNPSPLAGSLAKIACSEFAGGNTYRVDLTALQPEVTSSVGTFTWYSNQADPAGSVITGAALTNYTLTTNTPVYAEVNNGICSKVITVTYTINPSFDLEAVARDFNGFNLKCHSDNSGSITATTMNGGTAPFSFSIDGGPFFALQTFDFLAAGTHQVVAQDSKGCTKNATVNMTEPPALTGTLNELQPIKCFLDRNGIIETVPVGGTGVYTNYLLLQNPSNLTGKTTGQFSNIGIGSYNVRITDNNGCTFDTDPLTMDQPTQVDLASSVATDANGFNLSCRDASDGVITVVAGGGNGADYTYKIKRSGDTTDPYRTITGGTNESFTGLPFGNYTVTVVDKEGCSALPSIAVIVNPPAFEAGFIGINQSICAGADPVEIEELVAPFGGVSGYTYQWQQSPTGSANDADWSDMPAETGKTYDPPATLTQTTYYRRIVTSGSCNMEGKENVVKVTVNPLPVIFFDGPAQICQGETFFLQLNVTTGAAPIEYDYNNGTTSFNGLIGTANTLIPITDFQQNTTYSLTRVKDLNGCQITPTNESVTVNVVKISSDFAIIGPDEQCSGNPFTFQWTAEPNVKYTWTWSDGSAREEIITGVTDPAGVRTISHSFAGVSPSTSTVYPVQLQAENTLCLPKVASKTIKVYPYVSLNIIPGDTVLCSNQSIQFKNQSLGVDNSKWYYRRLGDTNQEDVRTTDAVTYTMLNNTVQNPIIYEVVYEASNNFGCDVPVYHKQVVVYRAPVAEFSFTPTNPSFVGGKATVVFQNESTPIDPGQFEYTWDFGDNRAVPPTSTDPGPSVTVDYFTTGGKTAFLKVVNIQARDGIHNKTCASQVSHPVPISMPGLTAAFTATPLAGCFPVEITVDNTSQGADTFVWSLYGPSGLIAESNLSEPVFKITAPGSYDIYLTSSLAGVPAQQMAQLKGIQVFDRPQAAFELRPNVVFVPDNELRTFNFTTHATDYFWDFGESGEVYTTFEPTYVYKYPGNYTVTLIAGYNNGTWDVDGDGVLETEPVVCYDTARQPLLAQQGGFTKIPNAFTPNPNGPSGGRPGTNGSFNDVFLPITKGVEEFEMLIYDRWGNMIFKSDDKDIGWDGYDKNGRLLPAGVYVYKLTLRLSDQQRTTQIGDLTLIR